MSADTLPELQKALGQEREARQRADGDVRALRTKLEDYMRADKALTVASEKWKARAEQAESALAAEQELHLRTLHRAERAEAERDRLKDEFHGLMNSRGDWQARAELEERELTAWRAETGAGCPEDAGAAIRNTREDLRQAEKERDDQLRLTQATLVARERAEADNAALSKHINTACYLMSLGQVDRAVSYLRKAAGHEHPGAALLEYVRALEVVRTAVEPTRRLTELFLASEHGAQATETERNLVDACARFDALKGEQ